MGGGHREADVRRPVVAVGEGVDEGRPLHAMRGAEVYDVHAFYPLEGLEDGAVGGQVAEAVEGRHVHEVGQVVESQCSLAPSYFCDNSTTAGSNVPWLILL